MRQGVRQQRSTVGAKNVYRISVIRLVNFITRPCSLQKRELIASGCNIVNGKNERQVRLNGRTWKYQSNVEEQSSTLKGSWGRALIENKVIAAVLALILLVPLLTGNARLNSIGKVAAFEVLGTVLLVLMLRCARLSGVGEWLKSALCVGPNFPSILLIMLGGFSCALSQYKAFALAEFLRIGFCVLVYFAIVYHARRQQEMQIIIGGLLLTTALVD